MHSSQSTRKSKQQKGKNVNLIYKLVIKLQAQETRFQCRDCPVIIYKPSHCQWNKDEQNNICDVQWKTKLQIQTVCVPKIEIFIQI